MGEPSSVSRASTKHSLDRSTDSDYGDEKGNLLAQHWDDSSVEEVRLKYPKSFVIATPKVLGTILLTLWTIGLLLLTILPHINWAPHMVVRSWRDSDMGMLNSRIHTSLLMTSSYSACPVVDKAAASSVFNGPVFQRVGRWVHIQNVQCR